MNDNKLAAIAIPSFLFFFLVLFVLWGGEPDLMDGIVKQLMECK